MSEESKSYRIRTTVGDDNFISVNLEQEYDSFDILSLKIKSNDVYRLHNSNYGVVVGRVLANNGFGIPNAKISIFIEADTNDKIELRSIYPFSTTASKDANGVRYNLLPDEKVDNCHQVVGTFPNKRYLLDNDDLIEVFDKYYKYTTRTNGAGDYMIVGVPTGNQTLHMDLDLSDCGILSQRPRDFVYKGYTVEQFENPNMFRDGTNYASLSQVFTQDQNVYIQPFWGNESNGETIGISRADIDVAFKFEPTCVFMGCVASDNASEGISKKCVPTPGMGNMDELVTGEGTIEMIRKTYAGTVEEFQVKGTELINGDGIWCYQIPMNLDYMVTDEYGNMVPTDNPDKGIPTRARVRFRISMHDMEENLDNYFRPKVLVPHNPQNLGGSSHEDYDYDFGTYTKDESFRDLFWNNVYTVKSYIPRFQKRKVGGWKEEKFTGIKHVQNFGKNNPMPYNNIRIRLPFMFKVMCIIIKIFIKTTAVINTIISLLGNLLADIGDTNLGWITLGITDIYPFADLYSWANKLKMNVIDEGMCPDLENWYFSPMFMNNLWEPSKKAPTGMKKYNLLKQTLESINVDDDEYSIDDQNQEEEDTARCLTIQTDYLLSCIEMNLAQEYKVINFDFYNDWINGMIYIPRFMRLVKPKKKRKNGKTIVKTKIKGCMDDTKIFSKSRRYTQLCSLGFKRTNETGAYTYSKVSTNLGSSKLIIASNNYHKKRGLSQQKIFGKNGGICHEKETIYGQFVYYLKPCEWTLDTSPSSRKVTLFATDIVLLGSLNDCDLYGIPQAFKHLTSTSYIMPTNLALTNMETNGPLYAYGNNGTMCSKQNQTTNSTTVAELSQPVRVVGDADGESNPLSDELKFYSGASSNYDVQYDDASDTIALTEAAGISWNYTGPGQGKIVKNKLYYPGGHFLGLSCVNSQTNIKSCVNLERICEVGTAMSQRREEDRGYDASGNVLYRYSVPTGLIAGDDIIDPDFRAMFATMNKKRLIATRLNPETGYFVYDFIYNGPINFNGELAQYTKGKPYNTSINVTEEGTESLLGKFGIFIQKLANTVVGAVKSVLKIRDDYDPDEPNNTQARTLEFASKDYYMFRLGLDAADLRKITDRHLRQFATETNGAMYLPQYENSYYFYFGTRDGSTALDEFNKQFFSECENSTLNEREPSSYMIVSEYDVCHGESIVTPYLTNMEGDIICYIEGRILGFTPSDGWYIEETPSGKRITGTFDNMGVSPIILHQGTYRFTAIDEEGTEVSTIFSVGNEAISGGTVAGYNFNMPLYNNVMARNSQNSDMFYGGYIGVSNLIMKDLSSSATMYLVVVSGGTDPYSSQNLQASQIKSGQSEFYVDKSNFDYDAYVKYRCPGTSKDVYIYLSSFNLMDTSDLSLRIGAIVRPYSVELKDSAFTQTWWRSYVSGATETGETEVIAWNIRKALVKENKDSATTMPFKNEVYAENGLKAIWGSPQNANGIYSNGYANPYMATSELEDGNNSGYRGIPEGYSLDDEASYYSTYGTISYPNTYQYNAAVYNGLTVGGPFFAIISGQTGVTKAIKKITNHKINGFISGTPHGVFFKPLPYGDLIPAIYSGGKITCLCEKEVSESEDYWTGIVYPTITYPVIRKPFDVQANYFEMMEEYIDLVKGNDGKSENQLIHGVRKEKCEAHVKNGLTFNKHYCGDSYMSMCFGEAEAEKSMTDLHLSGYTNDFTGLNLTTAAAATTYFSTSSNTRVEIPAYSVIEGYPMYYNESAKKYLAYYDRNPYTQKYSEAGKYENIVETRELDMGTHFYDDVYFIKDGADYSFYGIGYADSDIDYYLFTSGQVSNVIKTCSGTNMEDYITKTKGVDIFKWDSPRNVYIAARYTKKALYDVEGSETLVRIKDAGLHINAFVKWTEEPDDDSDGEYGVVEHKLKKINTDNFIDNRNFYTILKQVVEATGGRIEFFKKKEIKDISMSSAATETKLSSFTKSILEKLDDGMYIHVYPEGKIATAERITSFIPNKDNIVIAAVKKYSNNDDMARGSVNRIYLYPFEIKPKEGALRPINIDPEHTPIVAGAAASFYELPFSGFGPIEFQFTCDATWVTMSPTNRLKQPLSSFTFTANATVARNDTGEERMAEIILRCWTYIEGSDVTVERTDPPVYEERIPITQSAT